MRNDHLMTSLLTLSRHRFLDAAADIVVIAAAILAFLFLLAGYLLLPALPVYGHDEMHYYPSFYFKLLEDGRWLNYLLHDFLRSVPLPLWSMVYLSLAWVLFYRIARLYAFSAAYAALVASTIVLAYPFVEISLWPGTVVPVLLLGLLAIWLHAREIPYQVIYLVSGILMFGSMQTLYFVLPLLFVPEFLQSSQPPGALATAVQPHVLVGGRFGCGGAVHVPDTPASGRYFFSTTGRVARHPPSRRLEQPSGKHPLCQREFSHAGGNPAAPGWGHLGFHPGGCCNRAAALTCLAGASSGLALDARGAVVLLCILHPAVSRHTDAQSQRHGGCDGAVPCYPAGAHGAGAHVGSGVVAEARV
jgi:hypothetical protein